MGKTLTTFTIGGVLGAAMSGGLAIASASTPPPSEPRPAVVVDPNRAVELQGSLTMSAQSTPSIVSVASAATMVSAPSVQSAPAAPAPVATTKAPTTVKKQASTTTKVVKPAVKKVAVDSPDSAPSVDS